jgi:hypothetical protein
VQHSRRSIAIARQILVAWAAVPASRRRGCPQIALQAAQHLAYFLRCRDAVGNK